MTVPPQFRFQDPNRYPQDNVEDFEWWMSRHWHETTEREYLPITWTAYYKKHKYGEDKQAIAYLQHWLESNLDKGKKYWTIVQYDNNILNDLSAYDVKVFAMGSPGDYQLPLICQPHNYSYYRLKKDIFCSFVGRITHPIRQAIVDQLSGKEGYYISTQPHKLPQFCEVLARSKYIISSRGYGATSFRICEGLQYGAHIINLSDHFLRPHNQVFDEIIEVRGNLFSGRNLKSVIDSLNPNPDPKKSVALYNSHFTYEANKQLIFKHLTKI